MLEAHFGVPMSGAILNALNTRLDAAAIAFILEHCEAKAFLVDRQLSHVARDALANLKSRPLVIDIEDVYAEGGERVGDLTYEELLQRGDADDPNSLAGRRVRGDHAELHVRDDRQAEGCAVSPSRNLPQHPEPDHPPWPQQRFHLSVDATDVPRQRLVLLLGDGRDRRHACLSAEGDGRRNFSTRSTEHDVTHMCGAPTVLGMLIEGATKAGRKLDRPVAIMTAGAAPPAPVLKATEELGFVVRHVYGMTEVHGVAALCDWHREWDELAAEPRSKMMARQGVTTVVTDDMIVADPFTLMPVPADAATIGEILLPRQ